MIPLGLGVREASMLLLLNKFGIPNEIGLTVVIVQRIMTTGLGYVLGLVAAGILGVKKIKDVKF